MTEISTGCKAIDYKVKEWLRWDKNEKSSATLKKMLSEKKFQEVAKLLCKRLNFGTAGLRGRMGVGYAQLNDLVIIQTAQGYLNYLIKADASLLKEKGIIIGYDGRHNSKRWGQLTATIFVQAGYPVKLFSDVVPTPFVAFAIVQFGCASGVMVTASHNPKDDNGYKVYGPNGAQIKSPVDEQIQNEILKNLEPLESSWEIDVLTKSSLVRDPYSDIFCRYLNFINTRITENSKTLNKKTNLLFTYTAMHGVGFRFIKRICELINVRMVAVPEQKDPDPDFPTLEFPNPEEGKSSLELAIKYANANCSNLIVANDPDADRFALAEKNPTTGEWKIFNGNQVGTLFGWWLLRDFKLKNPNVPNDKIYMISSTVSSMILKSIAKIEKINYIDVLTGFKWLANQALDLEKQGYKVIFCFEESIGYMCSTQVPDKDGISACAEMLTMVSYIYSEKKTVLQQLEEIFQKYGYHISNNSYYICNEPIVIKNIFEKIRNWSGPQTYPQSICNGKYKIKNVRDLTTGYDDNFKDKKAILPVSASTEMITFYFENGLISTLRTSGTEPKIKYYAELCATPDIKNIDGLHKTLDEMVTAICEEFLNPTKNNLKPQVK